MYDCIIIGMGISGITAAIYAKRSNLNVLLIDKSMPGGLLNSIDVIDNYPGLVNVKGSVFAKNLFQQVQDLKIEYKFTEVINIKEDNGTKIICTENDEYKTKNVIIATGRRPKFLGLDNEKDLLGRGLSTCAVCDANFFKDKVVAVVGAGNSALQEALYLAKSVKKIYLLNRKDTFLKAEKSLLQEVENNDKIEIIKKVNIEKINEIDGKISSIILDNKQELDVSGVFIYIGFLPNSEIIADFGVTDDQGYILVDENCQTNISGIYAIGDVIKKDVYQLVTAASDGAKVIYKIK